MKSAWQVVDGIPLPCEHYIYPMVWVQRVCGRTLLVIALNTLLVDVMFGQVITWRRAYGAFGSDVGKSVRTTSDGHIVVAGSTGSFGEGTSDIYFLELEGNGVLQWSRTIGGNGIDQATSLIQMPDEGWLIAGYTNSIPGSGGYDGLLVRTNAMGDVLWQHTYGGGNWDLFQSGQALVDGGAIIAGQTFSGGAVGEAWLVRINAMGDTIWTRQYGGSGMGGANSVVVTSDGGYALTGSSIGSNNDENAFVLKTDALGNEQWSSSIGGDSLDYGNDIIQTMDGGYSIVGSTHSFSQWNEHYHFKLDGSGVLLWQKHWGQINDQEAFQHVELPSGGFATTGWTETSGGGGKDMFIFLCDSQGNFISQNTYGGVQDDAGFSIDTIAGGFVACGETNSYGAGGNDVFVVRTDEDANTATEYVETDFDPLSVAVRDEVDVGLYFPNPSAGTIRLLSSDWDQVTLLDATGRVLRKWEHPGDNIDISDIADGAYYLLGTDRLNRSAVSSLILQKH